MCRCAVQNCSLIRADCAGPDDGLVFRFRRQRCVPPALGVAVTQRLYCVATWSSDDDRQTYTVSVTHS